MPAPNIAISAIVVAYDDYYGVNAHDGRGRKVQLEVCAFTGEVLGQRTL